MRKKPFIATKTVTYGPDVKIHRQSLYHSPHLVLSAQPICNTTLSCLCSVPSLNATPPSPACALFGWQALGLPPPAEEVNAPVAAEDEESYAAAMQQQQYAAQQGTGYVEEEAAAAAEPFVEEPVDDEPVQGNGMYHGDELQGGVYH